MHSTPYVNDTCWCLCLRAVITTAGDNRTQTRVDNGGECNNRLRKHETAGDAHSFLVL